MKRNKDSGSSSHSLKIAPPNSPAPEPESDVVELDRKDCFFLLLECGIQVVVGATSWVQDLNWTKFYAETEEEVVKAQRTGKFLRPVYAIDVSALLSITHGDATTAVITAGTKGKR